MRTSIANQSLAGFDVCIKTKQKRHALDRTTGPSNGNNSRISPGPAAAAAGFFSASRKRGQGGGGKEEAFLLVCV